MGSHSASKHLRLSSTFILTLFITSQPSHHLLSPSPLYMHECFLVHYSLMMVAVCYRNVGKQVSQLASAYELSRCQKYLATQAFSKEVCLGNTAIYLHNWELCVPMLHGYLCTIYYIFFLIRNAENQNGQHVLTLYK